MGASFGKWWNKMEARVLLLGLDAAGKTTILYQMKLGEVVMTIPTIGFNVETIIHKKMNFTAWDIGGRDKMRPLYRHYFANTDAILYVIDSNDVERLDEAKEEMHRFLAEDQLRDSVVLVLANKQDLPNAMGTATLSERLQLHAVRQNCHIIPTVATTGDGLADALEWLHQTIVNRNAIVPGDVTNDDIRQNQPEQPIGIGTTTGQRLAKVWEIVKSLFIAS